MNQELIAIRSEVFRLCLSGMMDIVSMPIDELDQVYNGTGPEFLPDRVRRGLDDALRPFLPSVMVHDVDFDRSDGTVGSFRRANRRLLRNCIICACDAHPWWSWRRYVLIAEAFVVYRACQRFGWIAWLLAYNKNQRKKN